MGEKAGQLQARIAAATGIEAASVAVVMRSIREAGLITSTGGRGPSAPDMVPMDAARTLLAVMAVEQAGTKAGAIVQKVGAMKRTQAGWIEGPFNLDTMRGLSEDCTLEEAVAALISLFAFDRDKPAFRDCMKTLRDGSVMLPRIDLEVHDMESASIHMGRDKDGTHAVYFFAGEPLSIAEARRTDTRMVARLRRSTSASAPVIDHIAAGFRRGSE